MLVFSSAERTNSPSFRGCPSHTLSYKSGIRPAFSAKWGSRGKTQQRCCHGRMASSWSQRQTVVLLMLATNPDWRTWAAQIGAAPSRDGQSEGGGQLTGQGFNLDHYLWGEKTGGDPAESSPPDPSGVFRKSAFARNIPPLDGYPNVSRSHHYANPGLPGESSWLAVPENTVTYIFGHEPIVLFPHLAIERSYTGCVEALWNSFQVTTMPNQPDIIR